MAFTTDTTASLADCISKINSFLSANGWTTHHVPASGEFAARRTSGSVDIGFASQWDTTSPNNLGIYHFHGAVYNAGNSPWAQNDDSGNGFAGTTDASLSGQRFASITNTPVRFWCFEDDFYFNAVVQRSATEYVQFGAGVLEKNNDYTGGEYVYGHRQSTGFISSVGVLGGTSALLDGLAVDSGGQPQNMEEYAATIRVEGLDDQPAGGKYAVNLGNQASGNLGNDRQGVPVGRVHFTGGFRAGPGATEWGIHYGNVASGLLPGYPIAPFYWNRVDDSVYGPMGFMKDARGMSIRNYSPGEEITVGGDTWIIFPTYAKWPGSGALTNTSGHQGMIFKKVV